MAFQTAEAQAYVAAQQAWAAARQTAIAAVRAERTAAGITDSSPGYTPGPKEQELATLGIAVPLGQGAA
jgi:hypothetical protein